MSGFDWTHYFQKPKRVASAQVRVASAQVRVAHKTLFDAPPEHVEPEKPKKKPKTLFEAPPEPSEAPVSEPAPKPMSIFEKHPEGVKPPQEAPAVAPPGAPKSKGPSGISGEDKDLWDQFLKEMYGSQGGTTLITNTNPQTKTKYPKVQVNTLLKSDQPFHTEMLKKFEAWKGKQQEEEAPSADAPHMSAHVHSFQDLPDDKWHSIISIIEMQAGDFDGSVHGMLKNIGEIKDKLKKFGINSENMDLVKETLTALGTELAVRMQTHPDLDLVDHINKVQDYLNKHLAHKKKDTKFEWPEGDPLHPDHLKNLSHGVAVTVIEPDGDRGFYFAQGVDPKNKVNVLRGIDPQTGKPTSETITLTPAVVNHMTQKGNTFLVHHPTVPDQIPGVVTDHIKEHPNPPPALEEMPKEKPKKPKKKLEMETPDHPTDMQVGDVVTWSSGKKKYRGVVVHSGAHGFKVQKVKPNGEKWGKDVFFNKGSMKDKGLERYPEGRIPKKFKDLEEVKQKAEGPKKKKSPSDLPEHPPPPEGTKHVKSADHVQTGDAVTWEQDGVTVSGRVVDKNKGKFWVRAINPETGKAGDLWVLSQWDLDHLGVGLMEDDKLPEKFDLPKVPPKPEPPEHPPAPEKPLPPTGISKVHGTPISEMDDVKVGDYITYQTKSGTVYVAEVQKLEGDKWHVQVIDPQTGKGVPDKIRTFYVADGVNKFTQRKTHKLDPDALTKFKTQWVDYEHKVADWEPGYNTWQEEKSKVDSAHAEEVKKWKVEKDKIEGKLTAAKHPIEKQGTYNLQLGEDHGWDTDHEIIRKADDLVPELAEKYGAWLSSEDLSKFIQNKMDSFSPKGRPYEHLTNDEGHKVSQKLWDSRSQGEREMIMGATKIGQKFLDEVLTVKERSAFAHALSDWRMSTSYDGAKRIRGVLDEFVPFNKQDSDSSAGQDKALTSAVAKAMAWTQMVFDHFGVEDVRVYRGTKGHKESTYGPTWFDDLEEGSDVPEDMKFRSGTGFSTNPYIALKFPPHTIVSRVPPAQIFLGPLTDPGMIKGYDEDEWIVAGPQKVSGQYQGTSSNFANWDFDKMSKVSSVNPGLVFSASQLAQRYSEVRQALTAFLQS